MVRVLLFSIFVLLLFIYVVTIYDGPCNFDDFYILSSPGDGLSIISAGPVGSIVFIRNAVGSTAGTPALWTTQEWRKAMDYYSALFQDLLVEGFLSLTAKSLCVDTPMGHEVLALKKIGILDAIDVAKKKAPPLVIFRDNFLHLPFRNGTFEFIFADRSLDQSLQILPSTVGESRRSHLRLLLHIYKIVPPLPSTIGDPIHLAPPPPLIRLPDPSMPTATPLSGPSPSSTLYLSRFLNRPCRPPP